MVHGHAALRVDAPRTPAEAAERLRDASGRGDRLHLRGAASWWPDPADDATGILSLDALADISSLEPADLVVTAGAGCRLDRLAERLAGRGTWVALDPPGGPARTLGGVLAAGGGGPLAALFGPPRDQVLGLTVLSGDGTLVRLGGRVVKNVAGFDLAKVVIGAHGGFGAIVEANLRLRAMPAADRSWVMGGEREAVREAAERVFTSGASLASLEILDPGLASDLLGDRRWTLALRALGQPAAVAEELEAARAAAGKAPGLAASPRVQEGPALWDGWRRAVGSWPVVMRLGADPSAWHEAAALTERAMEGAALGLSVTLPTGTVRVGLAALAPQTVRALRREASERGWPVTLERADAATRRAVGIWGALDPEAERLTRELRETFDPGNLFAVPLLA